MVTFLCFSIYHFQPYQPFVPIHHLNISEPSLWLKMCELGYAIPTFENRLIFTHLSVIYGKNRGNKKCTKKNHYIWVAGLAKSSFVWRNENIWFFFGFCSKIQMQRRLAYFHSLISFTGTNRCSKEYINTHTHIIDQEKETHITSFSLALPTQ